jgi:hypothetical protein
LNVGGKRHSQKNARIPARQHMSAQQRIACEFDPADMQLEIIQTEQNFFAAQDRRPKINRFGEHQQQQNARKIVTSRRV